MSKLFLDNSELDKTMRLIRRLLRTSMNGVVADSMRDKGIEYKINWGVSLPRIKEIATNYAGRHDLAERLWAQGARETMIMAALIAPEDRFEEKLAFEWVRDVNNIELAEQLSMNLLSRLPYHLALSLECMSDESVWTKITGFTLAARIWKEYSDEQADKLISLAIQNAQSTDFLLYKSVANALARLCRRNEASARNVSEKIQQIENKEQASVAYIVNEITNEVSFLNF